MCPDFFHKNATRYCSKCAEKCASPKCQLFYNFFRHFKGVVYYLTFWYIFQKKNFYRILLHNIIKKSKCTSLSVSRTLRETKKINAQGGVDMHHFRAKSQHLDTLPTLICLFIACFFTCGDSRQVKLLFVLWKRGNVLFDNLNDLVAKSRSNNLGISRQEQTLFKRSVAWFGRVLIIWLG